MSARRQVNRLLAFAAALLLAACAFSSEAPLLAPRDAVFPFADGARFTWRETGPSAHERVVTFHRAGDTYSLTADDEKEPLKGLLFAPIPSTREEDYVVQMQEEGHDGVYYAFLWRVGDGYRVVADPAAIIANDAEEARLTRYCEMSQYRECAFRARSAVIGFYRAFILDRFVRHGAAPEDYIDLTPLTAPPTEP